MEATESKEKEALKRTYGKIVLTLENALITSEKLEDGTVSQRDGLSRQTELDLRFLGCELVQTAGILLKLPQVSVEKCEKMFGAPCLRFREHRDWKRFSEISISVNETLMTSVRFCYHVLGRYGIRTSAFPALLLFQIIRSSRLRGHRHGLHLLSIKDRRSSTTTQRRPQRLQSHQTDARSKVSRPTPISFLIVIQFINLFINQFCR